MDCAACQILERYAKTGLFIQPVECVFCQNVIDNESEPDREILPEQQNEPNIITRDGSAENSTFDRLTID